MCRNTGKTWTRGIALLVLFTFLSSTIAWSYPEPAGGMQLAADLTFQNAGMDPDGNAFLAGIHEDLRLNATLTAIADFIRELDNTALKYLPEILSREIPLLPESIDLNHVKQENGIISIYYRKGKHRGIIYIAEKESEVASRMDGVELPSSSARYRLTVKAVRDQEDERETPIADNDTRLPGHKLVNALIETVINYQERSPGSSAARKGTFPPSGDTVFYLGVNGNEKNFFDVYNGLPQKVKGQVFDTFRKSCREAGKSALEIDYLFAEQLPLLANMSGHAGVVSGNMHICAGVPDAEALLEHEFQERDIHRDMAAGYAGYGSWSLMELKVDADDLENVKRGVIGGFRARDDYNIHARLIHNQAMKMAPVGEDVPELVPDIKLPDSYEMPIAAATGDLPDQRLVDAYLDNIFLFGQNIVYQDEGREKRLIRRLKYTFPGLKIDHPAYDFEGGEFEVFFLGQGHTRCLGEVDGQITRLDKGVNYQELMEAIKASFVSKCVISGMDEDVAEQYVDLTFRDQFQRLGNMSGHASVSSGIIFVAPYHENIDRLIAHEILEMLFHRAEAAKLMGYDSWDEMLRDDPDDAGLDPDTLAEEAVLNLRSQPDYNRFALETHQKAQRFYPVEGQRELISDGAFFSGYQLPIAAGGGKRAAVDRLLEEADQLVRDGQKGRVGYVLLRARKLATEITHEAFRRET
ncbi:MAG: hypothetical protein GF392_06190, partial [Candidatus Omnitrophica bacterium]|nr:hypothetical protein [Candidatus Omnitrophota bacterium]